jgi:dTDP-4-amino-4,6-dideoxygalactose transaminase
MIPPFKPEFSPEEIQFVQSATAEILCSGRLVLGAYTDRFEAGIADMAQRKYAISVNSGTSALQIACLLADVKGRHVLVPSNTNFATAAAAVYAGANVELYDGGLYPNIHDLAARIRKDTAAIIIVHIGGYISPNMEAIAALCTRQGVILIEDVAHAHGARLGSKAAGSFGDLAAFSFFATKTVTTSEGGALVCDDEAAAKKARQYRDQGKAVDGVTHEVWGNSWRMTEIGAAIGLAQLKTFTKDLKRRNEIIKRYAEELATTALIFPETAPETVLAGYKAIALLPEGLSPASLKKKMLGRGVQLGKEVYEKPLHMQPIFAEAVRGSYAEAVQFAGQHICLPLWRYMSDQQVSSVILALREAMFSLFADKPAGIGSGEESHKSTRR